MTSILQLYYICYFYTLVCPKIALEANDTCLWKPTLNKVSCILHLLYLDYIVHDILWFKLVEMGVRGKMLNVS